jgi:Glycosyltransferase family 87
MATRAEQLAGTRRAVTLGATLLLVMISGALLFPRLANWPLTPDFTMLWAGGHFAVTQPHDTYNVAAVTAAQMSIRPPVGPLPFPYPPSALPMIAPFGLLPFWPAYMLWTALSAVAFWTAARRITSSVGLVFATPHMMLALVLGQTTLWIGALLIWGVLLLERRPVAAGLLFGIAGAIKPQFAVLLPVAILAGRHWKAIAGGFAGAAAMLLLSLPFGLFLWRDWAATIGSHPAIVSGYGLDALGATPMLALKFLGLPRWLDLFFVGAGAWLVGQVFRGTDTKKRVLVLLAATLIASPYAMRYELAMLAPSLVEALLAGTARGLLIALPLYCLNVLTIVPGLLISAFAAARHPAQER